MLITVTLKTGINLANKIINIPSFAKEKPNSTAKIITGIVPIIRTGSIILSINL